MEDRGKHWGDKRTTLLSKGEQASLGKPLVEPGDKVDDILMRTVLEDANEARDIALFIDWCNEFGLKEEKGIILSFLAAKASIKGLSRKEYSMVATQILAPSVWGAKDGKGKERKDNHNDGAG